MQPLRLAPAPHIGLTFKQVNGGPYVHVVLIEFSIMHPLSQHSYREKAARGLQRCQRETTEVVPVQKNRRTIR